MNHLEDKYGWLSAPQAYVSLKHEGDKMIVFERAGLVFAFNFHPTNSFTDYRIGVEVPGDYHIVLSSDEKRFGGFENIDMTTKFTTTPMEWNNRKNFIQVTGDDAPESAKSSHYLQIYIPSRTCMVLAKV